MVDPAPFGDFSFLSKMAPLAWVGGNDDHSTLQNGVPSRNFSIAFVLELPFTTMKTKYNSKHPVQFNSKRFSHWAVPLNRGSVSVWLQPGRVGSIQNGFTF